MKNTDLYGTPYDDIEAALDGLEGEARAIAKRELEVETLIDVMVDAPPARRYTPGRPQRSGAVAVTGVR